MGKPAKVSGRPATPCRECRGAVDHCHGTALIHADGTVDCTEIACVDLSESRHSFVLTCSMVVHTCGCREQDAALH